MVVNWDEMHCKGERPWDLKGVTPILRHFIEKTSEGNNLLSSECIKRVLIPGCGQKNDSEYLATVFQQSKVIGADISPTAVAQCQEQVQDGLDNLEFVEADFFGVDGNLKAGDFNLIFDHTFFCAIDPEIRAKWGEKMRDLLGNGPSGYLLTIIYPLPRGEEADLSKGPPYEVTFSAYEAALKGFVCVKRWKNSELPASNEKRLGREELALWKRE